MEVYYKDLISEDTPLEKLVDDLVLVVQGADEFAEAAASVAPERKEAIATWLGRLKEGSRRLRARTVAGARASDQALRNHPYSMLGVAFLAGLVVGAVVKSRR